MEEPPVEVLAHLVEDEPVADGAGDDVVLHVRDVGVVLEVPVIFTPRIFLGLSSSVYFERYGRFLTCASSSS